MNYGFSLGVSSAMFTIIPVIVAIGFVTVFGIMIAQAVRGGREWHRNNQSPILTVSAHVVSKRTEITNYHHQGANNTSHMSTSTTHYVTFEVESGDRMEFRVSGSEYGMLVKGDTGRLTFQGSRYHNFDRK